MSRLLTSGLLFLAIVIALAVLAPGLSGGFLLDDYPNLAVLNQVPENPALGQLVQLAGTGFAGILGRPLSIFSFLLQHETWPEPFGFKLINLLIHLFNGVLLAAVCQLLRKQCESLRFSNQALILIVFIWLIHPIQVSTVLYVVQRMTLLASMFILLGILGYLVGRKLLISGKQRAGLSLMLAAPAIGAALGLLSKENGVLIYAYLLVMEFFLLRSLNDDGLLRRVSLLAVYLPISIGAVAFLAYVPSTFSGYEQRGFTLTERLLTQGPVLLTYLQSILIPRESLFGLFHDDFPIFNNVLNLRVIASYALLIAGSVIALQRQSRHKARYSLFGFALFWFLAGHSMESSFIPLEIYFEHRNYLPLFGVLLWLVVTLESITLAQDGLGRAAVIGFSGLLVGLIIFTTLRLSSAWGDPVSLASSSVEFHPASYRAQNNYVQTLANAGQVEPAFQQHQTYVADGRVRVADYIRSLEFRCLLPQVPLPLDSQLRMQALNSTHDYSVVNLLNQLVPALNAGVCPSLPREPVILVVDNLLLNQQFQVSWPDLLMQRALLSAGSGDFSGAADFAEDSERLRPDVDAAILRVLWLIRAERIVDAQTVRAKLLSDYEREIQASSDALARLQNIDQQLQRQRALD